jgi:hypothetical protein
MSASLGQTVLLVFSRTAAHEAAAKSFDSRCGRKGNTEIADRLIRHTLATVNGTRLPVCIRYDTQQGTGTFGERLADAMESAFSKGYERVIAIGNDCPDISTPLLLDVNRRLDQNELVLGPANDGGVYLIGITKAAYKRGEFVALPWETAQLQDAWTRLIEAKTIKTAWLQVYHDVDGAADFKGLLARLPKWNRLKKQFLHLLASFALVPAFENGQLYQPRLPGLTPLRGPPPA